MIILNISLSVISKLGFYCELNDLNTETKTIQHSTEGSDCTVFGFKQALSRTDESQSMLSHFYSK